METQLQEKNPNRLKKYIAIVGGIFTCAFAVFGALASIKPSVKADALQYDFDEAVVLTADEVNNISFKEVANYLRDDSPDDIQIEDYYIIYNNVNYHLDEWGKGNNYTSFANESSTDYFYIYEDSTDTGNYGYIRLLLNDADQVTFTQNVYIHGTEIVKAFKESTITLTTTQLNDTTYLYLSGQIEDNYTNQLANSVIEYNGNILSLTEVDSEGNITWELNTSGTNFIKIYFSEGKFNYFYTNDDWDTELEDIFIDSIIIFNASYIVDNINAPLDTGNFITDLIALLTGGIVPTASAMGTGVSGLVDALAIQGSTMSAFMSIVLIFGGIALALALCRWVVNLLSSLGQRNN